MSCCPVLQLLRIQPTIQFVSPKAYRNYHFITMLAFDHVEPTPKVGLQNEELAADFSHRQLDPVAIGTEKAPSSPADDRADRRVAGQDFLNLSKLTQVGTNSLTFRFHLYLRSQWRLWRAETPEMQRGLGKSRTLQKRKRRAHNNAAVRDLSKPNSVRLLLRAAFPSKRQDGNLKPGVYSQYPWRGPHRLLAACRTPVSTVHDAPFR